MKKAFISVIFSLIVIGIASFTSGCNSSATETSLSQISSESFKLTNDMKNTLKELCSSVPDFFGTNELNTNYIRDFVFASYSSPKNNITIAPEDVQAKIKLIFGIEYDVSKLVYTDTYSYCYYDGENIIVQPASVDKLDYVFDSCTKTANGTYSVSFNMLMDDTAVGTRTMEIAPCDNENDFILKSASRQHG